MRKELAQIEERSLILFQLKKKQNSKMQKTRKMTLSKNFILRKRSNLNQILEQKTLLDYLKVQNQMINEYSKNLINKIARRLKTIDTKRMNMMYFLGLLLLSSLI